MTKLTDKIQMAIRYIDAPISELRQSDIDAVNMLLEDINAELAPKDPKYTLKYTNNGRTYYVAKNPRYTLTKPELTLVNEDSKEVWDDDDFEFTGNEIAGFPLTWDVFDWKKIDVREVVKDDEV